MFYFLSFINALASAIIFVCLLGGYNGWSLFIPCVLSCIVCFTLGEMKSDIKKHKKEIEELKAQLERCKCNK